MHFKDKASILDWLYYIFEILGLFLLQGGMFWIGLVTHHGQHELSFLCLCHSVKELTLSIMVTHLGIFFAFQKNLDDFVPHVKTYLRATQTECRNGKKA